MQNAFTPIKQRHIQVHVSLSLYKDKSIGSIKLNDEDVWVPCETNNDAYLQSYIDMWCVWLNDPTKLKLEHYPQEEYYVVGIMPNLCLCNQYALIFGYLFANKQGEYYFSDNFSGIQTTQAQKVHIDKMVKELNAYLKSFWK